MEGTGTWGLGALGIGLDWDLIGVGYLVVGWNLNLYEMSILLDWVFVGMGIGIWNGFTRLGS